MAEVSHNPETFRQDEELLLCAACRFSSQRPPQIRGQNLHRANGSDQANDILPCCHACRAPIIPHYPPSFNSDDSQGTVSASERANPDMVQTRLAHPLASSNR